LDRRGERVTKKGGKQGKLSKESQASADSLARCNADVSVGENQKGKESLENVHATQRASADRADRKKTI